MQSISVARCGGRSDCFPLHVYHSDCASQFVCRSGAASAQHPSSGTRTGCQLVGSGPWGPGPSCPMVPIGCPNASPHFSGGGWCMPRLQPPRLSQKMSDKSSGAGNVPLPQITIDSTSSAATNSSGQNTGEEFELGKDAISTRTSASHPDDHDLQVPNGGYGWVIVGCLLALNAFTWGESSGSCSANSSRPSFPRLICVSFSSSWPPGLASGTWRTA